MSEEGLAYFFQSVIRARERVCRQFAPRSLREALPNRTYTLPGVPAAHSYSEVAAIGHVTAAEMGPAFAHVGDDVVVPVDPNASSVAERTALAHVRVEDYFGEGPAPSVLVFQMGLLNARNPGLFLDGLRSLGHIAIVLAVRQRSGVLIPIEQGALIGRIDAVGRLTFPALAPEGREYLAGITTDDAFRAAAAEPHQTVQLDLPQGYA